MSTLSHATKLIRGAITPAQLAAATEMSLGEARYVVRADFLGQPVAPCGQLSRASFARLGEITTPPARERPSEVHRAADGFIKFALAGTECVAIPLETPGHYSACVSSQAGCAMACDYCATGTMGLRRNLSAWEIVAQVHAIAAHLGPGQRVAGAVFQGMGEPMANLDAVLQAIDVLRDPCTFGIDARKITVSTCGLPRGMVRLGAALPKVRLGLSIGSLVPAIAERLLPVRKQFPWPEVFDAAAQWSELTGRAPMWAVTLLAGENDALSDADALAHEALRFRARTGMAPRLSVIAFNPWGGAAYQRASRATEQAFIGRVMSHGLAVHRRYSGGGDVAAACGQLVAAGASLIPGIGSPRRQTRGESL